MREKKTKQFRRSAPALVGLLAFLLSACRFDYEENVVVDELTSGIPDVSIERANFFVVRDTVTILKLNAEKADIYQRRGKREMKVIVFEQFDRDGTLVIRGKAAEAIQDVQSEDVEFSGGIEVELLSQGAVVKAEHLSWQAQAKVMRGRVDESVEFIKDDGSRLTGKNLFLDAPGRIVELDGGVSGVIVAEGGDS